MNKAVITILADAIKQNKSVAHLTIVEQQGSSPRRNAEMVIDDRGNILAGTIGGGGVERRAIEDALDAIAGATSKVVHYKLKVDKDDAAALQMTCGGDVTILIKPYLRARRLVVVGAGHISLALSKMAEQLDYRYVVIDDRPDYANAERFPTAEQIISGDVKAALAELETFDGDAFVIVSHDHIHDLDALIALKDKPHFYLGMIGSKNKVRDIYDKMAARGLSFDVAQIYAPIGIDIGGETPAEIALAIMAQIQAKWHGKAIKSKKHQSIIEMIK